MSINITLTVGELEAIRSALSYLLANFDDAEDVIARSRLLASEDTLTALYDRLRGIT